MALWQEHLRAESRRIALARRRALRDLGSRLSPEGGARLAEALAEAREVTAALTRLAGPRQRVLTRARRRLHVSDGARFAPPGSAILWTMRQCVPSLGEAEAVALVAALVRWLCPRARVTAAAVRARYVRGT